MAKKNGRKKSREIKSGKRKPEFSGPYTGGISAALQNGIRISQKTRTVQNVAVYGRTGTELPGTERAACRTGGCEGHCLSTV